MRHGPCQLLQRQILTQLGLETGRRHALATQGRFVTLTGKLAVDLEAVDAADGAADRIVAGEHTHLVRFQHQQALVDQIVEHGLARHRIVEHLRIQLTAHLGTQALLLVPQCLLELLLGNLDVADFGNVVTGAGIADVGLDTEKGEWQCDQRQKDLDDALVVTDCVEHERKNPSIAFRPAGSPQPKRGNDTVVCNAPI